MLDRTLVRLKPAIVVVTNEEPEMSKDLLSADERKTLTHIREFLHAFYDATMATQVAGLLWSERSLQWTSWLTEEFEDHDFMRESLHAGLTKSLDTGTRPKGLQYISPLFF